MTVFVLPGDGRNPYQIKHEGELPLEKAQEIVGGYVEMVVSGHTGSQMILNEEGKLHGLPLNVTATSHAHAAGMIPRSAWIVGPAIVLTGENRWM